MKMIKNLKYVSLTLVFIFGVFANINQVQADWFDSAPYEIPYDVAGGGTCPNGTPTSNAGISRSITLPTNSLTIPPLGATATDPEGGVMSYLWSQVLGSSTATITNGSTLEPTFSNLVQGAYTFSLLVSDDCGTQDLSFMSVTVNGLGSNIPPVADAGTDQSINQPTSATSVTGSGTDSDGTVVGYSWAQVGTTPAVANIVAPTSASTSITGLSAIGTYTFNLTVTDDDGDTGVDQMQIVISATLPPSATGSLTIDPNTCTIALGASTCTVTGAYWNTTGTADPKVVDVNTGTTLSTLANNPISSKLQVYVAYPSTLFRLMDGTSILDTRTATANCGANSWNGSQCVVSTVNGVCAPTHFSCSAGTSINNNGSGPWTWSCQGSGGGSTASCNEAVGIPVCNDTIDNDGDTLIDTLDPGCHSDGNAANPASYVPNDISEKNTRIKEIEV